MWFVIVISKNSDYFLKQLKRFVFCVGDSVCFEVDVQFSCYRPEQALEDRKVKASGFFMTFGTMKVVRSSPLRSGRLHPQEYPGPRF
jgi:hypothetical protein